MLERIMTGSATAQLDQLSNFYATCWKIKGVQAYCGPPIPRPPDSAAEPPAQWAVVQAEVTATHPVLAICCLTGKLVVELLSQDRCAVCDHC